MVITLMQTHKQTRATGLHSNTPYHSMQSVQLPVVRDGEISSACVEQGLLSCLKTADDNPD